MATIYLFTLKYYLNILMKINEEKYREASKLLCHYLRKLAVEKKITQEHLAVKTGFSSTNVNRMLSGKHAPTLHNFLKLAEAIDTYFFVIDKNSEDDLVETMKNIWRRVDQEN